MDVRTTETVSVTDIQRRSKELFERMERGEQEKYVILKNNEIAAVLLPAARYEALMDELEDLRIEAVAADRAAGFDPATAISHEEMLAKFAEDDPVAA